MQKQLILPSRPTPKSSSNTSKTRHSQSSRTSSGATNTYKMPPRGESPRSVRRSFSTSSGVESLKKQPGPKTDGVPTPATSPVAIETVLPDRVLQSTVKFTNATGSRTKFSEDYTDSSPHRHIQYGRRSTTPESGDRDRDVVPGTYNTISSYSSTAYSTSPSSTSSRTKPLNFNNSSNKYPSSPQPGRPAVVRSFSHNDMKLNNSYYSKMPSSISTAQSTTHNTSPSIVNPTTSTLLSSVTNDTQRMSLTDIGGYALKPTQGLVGLRNLGNTCYMNSILQCLSATECLTTLLLSKESELLKRAKAKGVVQGYVDLLKQMWTNEKTTSAVAPSLFKQRIQRLAPQFQGYDQHDSQEFLRFLLDGLHNELNTAHPSRGDKVDLPLSADASEFDKGVHAWERSLKYDNSEISDIFMGQLQSTLTCKTCNHTSVTFDPFWDLSLSIPRSAQSTTSYLSSYSYDSGASLKDCYKLFTAVERLDKDNKPFCEKCQDLQPGTKKLSIERFPKILVIHLKRFSGLHFRTKLSTNVKFEERMTLSTEKGLSVQYQLYAISNHSGSCYGGHYTSYCKHPVQGRWYQFNDSSVAPVSSVSIQSNQAYVLFYQKTE